MPSTQPAQTIGNTSRKLDRALEDTFPASDPPAATSFTPPAPASVAANSALEDMVHVYVVISADMAEKPPAHWRSCRHGRWVSGVVSVLNASMTPAAALLECLAKHDCGNDTEHWIMVTLAFPAEAMRRLDTPHESWRERPYRADVRAHGDQWAIEQQSLALRVPSAICPEEFNVIINRAHPDFDSVTVEKIQPLEIDPRL